VSGCVSGSLLRREEGDSVIDILIETGDNSREDIDRHETNTGTNIDTGAAIEVGKTTDTLIELGSSGAGYRAGCRVGCKAVEVCLKISASDWGGFWGIVGGTRRSKADGSRRVEASFLHGLPLGLAGSGSRMC
jgi:hypothetical protein